MKAAGEVLRLGSVGAIVFAALVRAMTTEARTPYWDLDPLLARLPETALLPAQGFALDALVWAAAAAAGVGEWMGGRRVMWRTGVLVGIGALGVFLHGLVLTPIGGAGLEGDFRSMIVGSAWASAMVGAWALAQLGRDVRVRQSVGALLLGFVALLAVVGAYQYFREHAITVSQFDADPARLLAAQGLEPGSAGARAFERRMRQPEATGWFGLANVYGSFATAGLVGWLGFAVASWKVRRRRLVIACAAGAVIAAGALVMSGSKGAWGAAALGVGVIGVASVGGLARALGGRWRLVALGVVLAPLAGVMVRGLVGERIGELSLLFRWHYAVAAVRVFGEHPVVGVGPAGFKVAYALAKVPTNPEAVESAHSVLLDWVSALGVFGLAWAVVWLGWVVWGGRALDERTDEPAGVMVGRVRGVALLAALLAVLVAWRMDMRATLPEEMVVRSLGAGLWVGLMFLPLPVSRLALGAAALAMAAHMQLEMTAVRTGSAGLAMALIGLAAAPTSEGARPARSGIGAGVCAGTALAATVAVAVWGVAPAWGWQSRLRAGAEAISATDTGVTPSRVDAAVSALLEADSIAPSLPAPRFEAARLRLLQAHAHAQAGRREAAARASGEAVEIAGAVGRRFPGRATVWSRLGALHVARFELTGEREELERGARAWERAAALDPAALTPAVRAWRLNARLGRRAEAVAWGLRALEVDELLRLDPVVRLSEGRRAEIEAYVEASSASGTSGAEPPS